MVANIINELSMTLRLTDVSKSFKQGNDTVTVLDNMILEVPKGQIVSLVGSSGSGKTTLLQIAGLLDQSDSGEISIDGKVCSNLSDYERTLIRRKHLGFVYQFHHLFPEFSAAENIAMPLIINGLSRKKALVEVMPLMEQLNIKSLHQNRPSELSGGEQQRVAIARALVHKPSLLLADEPTGNLDPETTDIVFALILEMVRKMGLSALIVTHDLSLADQADLGFCLERGQIIPR